MSLSPQVSRTPKVEDEMLDDPYESRAGACLLVLVIIVAFFYIAVWLIEDIAKAVVKRLFRIVRQYRS